MMMASQKVGKRRQQQRESDKREEETSSPAPVFPSLLPLISLASCGPPSLLPLSSPLCSPRPTPPFSPSVFTCSASFLSQSLLFMKVNLLVYQELLAGGGLHSSNHNKASPSTWNRDGVVGSRCCFHQHTCPHVATLPPPIIC